MPFVLQHPQQVVIDTVRITSFSVNVEAMTVQVNFVRGSLEQDGSLRVIDGGSASFSSDEVASVDSNGAVYGSMKAALYSLLTLRLGDGQIS